MMKQTAILLLGAALTLSACSKGGGASGGGDAGQRLPGMWETQVSLDKFEFTNLPPGAEAQMAQFKEAMKQGFSENLKPQAQCVTAEMIAKDDPASTFTKSAGDMQNCTFAKKDFSGGKIDVAGICDQGGQKFDLTMVGTMGAEKMDTLVTMKTNGTPPAGQPGMDMAIKVVANRTGECKA
jgi:hypothetical protein